MWLREFYVHLAATSAGIIYEEAVAKCGGGKDGRDALRDAIDEGRVETAKNSKGHQLYYFPLESIGSHDTTIERQNLSRSKGTSGEAFDTVKDVMRGMKWVINATSDDCEAIYTYADILYI